MSRIQIEGLTRRFGAVTAVDHVDLDVPDGDFLVLLGPSGCGKSTLLRMLAGLTPPSEGRILLDGRDITTTPPRDRDLAMVFQSYALYPHLTVARNIGFPLRTRHRPRAEIAERVEAVTRVLGLGELLHRRPRELSGGQRQRVALARALVRNPGAFLLDEPLSNLDATLRTATRAELTELHRRLGSTFVHVTHDQVEAMTMATRIAVLNGGRLEQVGTPAQVYDEPASVFVAGFLGSPTMGLVPARLENVDGALHVRAADLDIPLGVHDPGDPGRDAGRDVVLGIRAEHLTLLDPAAPDRPGEARLRGTVRLVENLGSEEVAHCLVGDARLPVRGPRPLGLAAGDAVTLTTAAERIHLFDPTGGRRLVWRPAPEPDLSSV